MAQKYKRLTLKEKKMNREIKKQLQDEGIIEPNKKRLNRTKFAREAKKEFKESIITYLDAEYIFEAFGWMSPVVPDEGRAKISQEEVGILKVMKIAAEIKKFKNAALANGETEYKPMELYEKVIKPIKEL